MPRLSVYEMKTFIDLFQRTDRIERGICHQRSVRFVLLGASEEAEEERKNSIKKKREY